MSGKDKLKKRFLSIPKDFTWDELIKILHDHEFEEIKKGKTSGSRRKFIDSDNKIISIHKPHPGNIVKPYVLRYIKEILIES